MHNMATFPSIFLTCSFTVESAVDSLKRGMDREESHFGCSVLHNKVRIVNFWVPSARCQIDECHSQLQYAILHTNECLYESNFHQKASKEGPGMVYKVRFLKFSYLVCVAFCGASGLQYCIADFFLSMLLNASRVIIT